MMTFEGKFTFMRKWNYSVIMEFEDGADGRPGPYVDYVRDSEWAESCFEKVGRQFIFNFSSMRLTR